MPVEFGDATCVRETERAVLIESDELPNGRLWIPRSVLDESSEVSSTGQRGTLILKSWYVAANHLK
jgi:hypothetical protein